jgi:diguanylate cyclase
MTSHEQPMEQTADFVRRAIPLMSKFNISFTPMNYSIWYKYVSLDNEELTKAIDNMIESGAPFSPETNEDLYRRFCTVKEDNEPPEVRDDLEKVLLTIFNEMTEFTVQTEEYEQFITNSVNMLSGDNPIEDIRTVIGEIREKTRTLISSRKLINTRLQETAISLEMHKNDFTQTVTEETTDFLTGVANKKSFDEALIAYEKESQATGLPLVLMSIDIDWFKRLNDQYGQLIGDEVLKFVAMKIKEKIGEKDFLARIEGDEFAIIFYQTPPEAARKVAEEIRGFFTKTPLKVKNTSRNIGTITISIGIAVYQAGEPLKTLIRRTNQVLSLAKSNGRNRVEWYR